MYVLQALRTCGLRWFVNAIMVELRVASHANNRVAQQRIVDVAFAFLTLGPTDQVNDFCTIFLTGILPELCQSIATFEEGSSLAELAFRVYLVLLRCDTIGMIQIAME